MTSDQAWNYAVQLVLKAEGPMSNDAYDPGGLTKYGIAQASHPGIDVANLTEDQALHIYYNEYWLAHSCDKLPWPVSLVVFDGEVNQGDYGAMALQRAVKVAQDGNIGPATLTAVSAYGDPWDLAGWVCTYRLEHYITTFGFDRNETGWFRRVANLCLASGRQV